MGIDKKFKYSKNTLITGKLIETYMFLNLVKKERMNAKFLYKYLIFLEFFSAFQYKVFWFRKDINGLADFKIKSIKELSFYFYENKEEILSEYKEHTDLTNPKTTYENFLILCKHLSRSDRKILLRVCIEFSDKDIYKFYKKFSKDSKNTNLNINQLKVFKIDLDDYLDSLDFITYLHGKLF